MNAPYRGQRFWDKDLGCVVSYIGDSGSGPRWYVESGGSEFYCDWLDYYLWNRFEALR